MELKNKKITILGMGISGVSAANLVKKFSKNIFISEVKSKNEVISSIKKLKKGIKYETGGHTDNVLDSDLIIRSPGIPSDIPVMHRILDKKIPVYSEIELSWELIKPREVVAVTGTNGKTTTVTLIGEIYKEAGRKTVVAGNIGKPLSLYVNKIDSKTYIVLEVSSYQLENIHKFKPEISALLNITPDHLEHHGNMDSYINAKRRIFENQTSHDIAVFNFDDRITRDISESCKNTKKIFFSRKEELKKGVFYREGVFKIKILDKEKWIKPEIKIPGIHNIENILCAITVCSASGIDPEIIEKAISEFKGVEHRIEFVREINGVKYINDSKSTNVSSTLVAINSFENNIQLIMGGRHKGFPYKILSEVIKKKVKSLFLIGEATEKIYSDLKGTTKIYKCKTLKNAVSIVSKVSTKGDIILFSPGCSSFDQFKNFEERGRYFKKLVHSL